MTRFPFGSGFASAVALLSTALFGFAQARVAQGAKPDQPIRALLIAGGCCHDYAHQKDLITKGISARANVEWTIAYDPNSSTGHLNPIYDKKDWAKGYDVVVHDECSADVKDLKIIDRILKPHRDGLPAVILHCGMHCYRSAGWPNKMTPWFAFTGLRTDHHNWQKPIAIDFVDKESPITKGLADWTTINEELYISKGGKVIDTAHVLARGTQARQGGGAGAVNVNAVVWTNIYNGKTRVFATTLGHNNQTVADPRYLDLITRGLLWSVGKLDADHLKPAKKVLLDGNGK